MKREFAKRLMELRDGQGISYHQLGKKLGIGASTICRWENGSADIKSDQLVQLAKYFKVSTDYILGLSEAKD